MRSQIKFYNARTVEKEKETEEAKEDAAIHARIVGYKLPEDTMAARL